MKSIRVISALLLLFISCGLKAKEYHVSKIGNDSNIGTVSEPLLTISAAASKAYPGDEIIVHQGVYRERITPPRGGESESKRIIYRAADNEKVIVKGSEQIISWIPEGQHIWRAELPSSFFGDYNPYYLKLNGSWLHYGLWHHRGDVYYDGEAYYEKQSLEEVQSKIGSWCSKVEDDITTIWANFPAGRNPNRTRLAEINVRSSLFFPEISGLKYITVDGFHFQHSADNWGAPNRELQMAAVGTRMGQHWIIENCTISNARCSGISLGTAPGDYETIDEFGDHIIRNNIIRRCGQTGIVGLLGATRCSIVDNLIEDINYRLEFGGFETAGIKFHRAVDTYIAGNLIRGVHRLMHSAHGIWIDAKNQGVRVTGNIIYNVDYNCIFLEINHGGFLVDNNILVGGGLRSSSGGTAFAHNLLVDGLNSYRDDSHRIANYYKPHTLESVGEKGGSLQDNKWLNNIFIKQGLDELIEAPGYLIDYNVYLEKAKKCTYGDDNSTVDSSFVAGFLIEDEEFGATISFNMSADAFKMDNPIVDDKLVGVFEIPDQTIEDRNGKPITVNKDMNGSTFKKAIPGPISDLREGNNVIKWTYKKYK